MIGSCAKSHLIPNGLNVPLYAGEILLHVELLELRAHPADHLQHHPGAGLLEHGHRVTVGDTLQAVAIHCQQPAIIKILII